MSEVATLGIRLDSQGFVTNANQAAGALFGLGESAKGTQSKVRAFATQGAVSLGQLASSGARDIGSLLRSASGLAFAFGPIAGAIGLAITGIGVHWWETRQEAQKAQEQMLRDMESFERDMKGAALRMRIARLESQRDDIDEEIRDMPLRVGSVITDTRKMNRLIAERERLNDRISVLRNKEGKQERDAASKYVEDWKKAFDERAKAAEEVTRIMQGQVGNDAIVKKVTELLGADDGIKRTSILTDVADASKKLGDEFKHEIGPAVDDYLDALKEAERVTKQIAENQANMALGTIFGAMGQHGGAFGGILSGAGFGFLSGGGPGAAIGAIGGLIGAMDALGNSAAEQRREMEALQRQYDSFTDGIKEQLGIMTPLEFRLRAAAREFAAMRDAIVSEGALSAFEEFGEVMLTAGVITRDQIEKVGALNTLERQYLDLLKRQEEQRVNDIGQESAILRLRIQGQDELADGMQRTIEKQNELRDALAAGASQAEITAIKERQRLEDILKAVEQTQERIASFAATIANLQAFRNALLLSPDAGLSPTQQLAEARRQYEDILTKALGGDQQAAGMLTGAAQTLLQFSRAVNASGPSFQDDLAKVLADNAAVIAKFEDLKTIEELMLEQLRQIAEDTGNLTGRAGSDPNRPNDPRDHGLHHLMQEGFIALDQRLAALTQRVEEQTQVNRQGFGDWVTFTANSQN